MKTHRSTILIVVLLMGLLLSAAVTAAQTTDTLTYTEAEINASYRVTNPARSSLTNVRVDLKIGAVDIYATHTARRTGVVTDTVTQLEPSVGTDGSIDWTVVSVSNTSGQALSADVIASVNQIIANSWVNYWGGRTYRYDITGVLVTEDNISVDYVVTAGQNPVQPTVTAAEGAVSLTYTESELNQAYRVTNPRRQTISNVVVDLQPGQVVISATLTPARGDALETVTNLVPEINHGQLTWTVINITADGAAASSTTLAQVNTAIVNSWVAHWRQNLGPNALTGIVILDDTITYTYSQ